MSSDKPEEEIPDQFEDLFGAPPLLEGEDPKRYLRLRAAIVRDLKPKTALEWINAKDHIDKVWEEDRYKRAAAALINSAMVEALACFLTPICEVTYGDPTKLALQYFSADPKDKKRVISLLAQYGITIAELQAKAAQLGSGGLQMFDRLVAARENGRRLLRKEAERRSLRQDHDPDEITD
jgi:hypothetical protein